MAKGSSVVQDFTKRNEPFGKLESISHGKSGFGRFGSRGSPTVAQFDNMHAERRTDGSIGASFFVEYIYNGYVPKDTRDSLIYK